MARDGYRLLAGIGILILLIPSTSLGFKNEPTGFGGIEWGTNINDLSGMKMAAAIVDFKSYESVRRIREINGVKIQSVLYMFYKDRLCSVYVSYQGHSTLLKLESALSRTHGQPIRPWEEVERFLWEGDTVDFVLRYKEEKGEGCLIYWFKPIMDEMVADEEERRRRILE